MGLKLGGYIAAGLLKGVGQGIQSNINRKRTKDELAYKEKKATLIRDEQRKYDEEQDAIVRGFKQEDKAKDRAYREQQEIKQYRMKQKGRLQLKSQDFANSLKRDKIISQRKLLEENFTKDKETGKAFEKLGKMSPPELAYLAASKVAKNYPKDEYGYILNQTLKSYNGYDKSRLIGMLDGYQPDYTKYEGTEYEESIPRPTGLGGTDLAGIFDYSASSITDQLVKNAEVLTDKQRKVKATQDVIQVKGTGEFGVPLSLGAIEYTRANANEEAEFIDEAGNRQDSQINVIYRGLESGRLVNLGDEIVPRAEAEVFQEQARVAQEMKDKQQLDAVDLPTEQPAQDTPLMEEGLPELKSLGVDEPTVAIIETKKRKAQEAKTKSGMKSLNSKDTLSTASQIASIMGDFTLLPDEQFSVAGVGISGVSVARDFAAAVTKDPLAIQAKEFKSKVANVRNKLRNNLFGATLTPGEGEAFDEAWEALGAATTREGYTKQLDIITGIVDSKITAVLSESTEETQRAMARRSPEVLRVMADNIMKQYDLDPSNRDEVERRILEEQ